MISLPASTLLSLARLTALRATGLVEAPPDESFDHLTRIAANALGVRLALVTVVDAEHQVRLSCWPPELAGQRSTPREDSLCQHVVATAEPLLVADARVAHRFAAVARLRECGGVAYAGVPLRAPDGEVLGSFCAIDAQPRLWSERDVDILRDLAAAAGVEIARRTSMRTLAWRDAQHAALLDQTEELVVATDRTGRISLVNRAWREKLGYSLDEAREINPVQFVAPEQRASYLDAARRLFAGESIAEFEAVLVARDGRRLVCRGHAEPQIEDGEIVGASAVYRDVTEIRRAEHVRARLVATLEASPDFVAIASSERQMVFMNRAGRRLVGLAEDADLSRLDSSSLRTPAENERLLHEIIPAAVRDGVWQGDSSLLDRDGNIIPVSFVVVAHPSTHPGEPPYFLSVVARDLRERIKVESTQRAAEASRERDRAFQRAVLENLSDGIVACDAEGSLTLFNRALREMHGLPAASIPPEQWSEHYALYHDDGVTPLTMAEIPLYRALQGQQVVDQEMVIAPRGRPPRSALATGQQFHDADGRLLGAVVAMRDVTEQKESERALRDSEERFRTVVENLAVGLVITDLRGIATYVNRRMSEITGYAVDELVGRELETLLMHPEARLALASHLEERRDGHGSRYSVEHIRRDGSVVWVEIAGVPYRDSIGRVIGTVGSVTDISERRRWEGALFEAKEEAERANRSKTEFLSRASHELRTPLNSVIGFASILLKNRQGTLNESDVSFMERIRANGTHLLSLVNDLLDVAKVESGHMSVELSPVLLYDLVHEVLSTLEGRVLEKEISLVADVSLDLAPLVTDAAKLKQVLINLVGNGIKFTERGAVTVRVIGDATGSVRSIVVADTGCGIPAADLPRIFDAFTQAESSRQISEAGTGLGLAICRSFCDLLGYRLRAESTPGAGTSFIIDL